MDPIFKILEEKGYDLEGKAGYECKCGIFFVEPERFNKIKCLHCHQFYKLRERYILQSEN